jgi:periplasmic divalent cation tolerance protein
VTDKIVVLSTCGTEAEAETIARAVLEKRLAACVNVVSGVRSLYRWQGKIEDSAEWLLVIKSSRDLFERLRAEIERVHSYQTPEVVAVPIVAVAPNYLLWLDHELAADE